MKLSTVMKEQSKSTETTFSSQTLQTLACFSIRIPNFSQIRLELRVLVSGVRRGSARQRSLLSFRRAPRSRKWRPVHDPRCIALPRGHDQIITLTALLPFILPWKTRHGLVDSRTGTEDSTNPTRGAEWCNAGRDQQVLARPPSSDARLPSVAPGPRFS
jgi:hypothetical protein